MKKLKRSFYQRDALQVAQDLLGKILVHKTDQGEISGKIVEVEAYIGSIDKAAHTYNNRRTARTEIMFGVGGFAYVYFIYGMYYCMNVVAGEDGDGQAVLIRALEPIGGIEQMAINRFNRPMSQLTRKQKNDLTNGPGKLCKALSITKDNYGDDLTGNELFVCECFNKNSADIVKTKRINIDYAEEAREFEWRFYIKDNPYVSKQ